MQTRTPSRTHRTRWVAAGLLASSVGLLGLVQAPTQAADPVGQSAAQVSAKPKSGPFVVKTRLNALNNSGVKGHSKVIVDGRKVTVSIDAKGLVKKAPHAMHFHFDKASRNTCPTVIDDVNADHRLSTSEGAPAYGSVRYSLTEKGNTSPKSALAVDRFPTADKGKIHYDRKFKVSKRFAKKILRGDVAVVVHGIDYNQNGVYDGEAGESDLDPSLPTEATDPVACGILS